MESDEKEIPLVKIDPDGFINMSKYHIMEQYTLGEELIVNITREYIESLLMNWKKLERQELKQNV